MLLKILLIFAVIEANDLAFLSFEVLKSFVAVSHGRRMKALADWLFRMEIAGKNLMSKKGVRITADSQEGKEFDTAYLADGITDDNTRRWSSVNDWEDNEHWVMAAFPESVQVGSVKIFWERQNAAQYALEYSQDGKNWTTAAVFEEPSAQKEQYISLEEPVEAKYLRLHVTAVTKEEADLSLYYRLHHSSSSLGTRYLVVD